MWEVSHWELRKLQVNQRHNASESQAQTYCEGVHLGELFEVDAATKDRDRDEEALEDRNDEHGVERLETVREPVDLREAHMLALC